MTIREEKIQQAVTALVELVEEHEQHYADCAYLIATQYGVTTKELGTAYSELLFG